MELGLGVSEWKAALGVVVVWEASLPPFHGAGMTLGASGTLGQCSTSELYPEPHTYPSVVLGIVPPLPSP